MHLALATNLQSITSYRLVSHFQAVGAISEMKGLDCMMTQLDLEAGVSSQICLNYVHPSGGWTYYFCFFRRPASAVRTLGFRSFEGKVFILSLPNLAWVFIGLIACMGLLLVKIGV